jgi:oligoribonuclease
MASPSNDRLVWIDCEMTGLNPEVDVLVEVAVVITDYDLKVLHPGLDLVIKPPAAALEQMGDFVRTMHTTSGLIDELDAGIALEEAQEQLLAYVREYVPEAGIAPLAGNTVGTDRMFIQKELPLLHEHLHYRNIDVSTVKELSKHWYPKSYFHSPDKNGGHRALADILESIRELAYYRHAVFVHAPGPETSAVKKIKDAITEEWAEHL